MEIKQENMKLGHFGFAKTLDFSYKKEEAFAIHPRVSLRYKKHEFCART
jgi:hypothetical protein